MNSATQIAGFWCPSIPYPIFLDIPMVPNVHSHLRNDLTVAPFPGFPLEYQEGSHLTKETKLIRQVGLGATEIFQHHGEVLTQFATAGVPPGRFQKIQLHSVPHDGVFVLTEMASLDAGPFSLNSIEQSNSGLMVVVDLQTLICEPIGQ